MLSPPGSLASAWGESWTSSRYSLTMFDSYGEVRSLLAPVPYRRDLRSGTPSLLLLRSTSCTSKSIPFSCSTILVRMA